MSFIARDVYGNKMLEDPICSFFTHNRFIIYFNVVFVNPTPKSDVGSVKIVMDETFDLKTSLKKFTIDAIRPIGMKFQSMMLNYTLYDGLNYKNGILLKYYSNNNFLDKPLYITRLPSTFIDSVDFQSNWYMFHKQFKDFSVKMTTMMYVPKDVGTRLTFITGLSSRLQLFVDDKLVINFEMPSGSIDMPSSGGYWTKIKILYRYSGNKMDSSVP